MGKTKIILIIGLMSFFFVKINAQTVKISDTVTSVEKFLQIRDKIATTPEGGAAMFLLAMKIYSDDPKLGKQCLVIAADQDNLQKGDTYMEFDLMPLEMKMIKMAIIDKNRRLPYSYIQGSKPENNYTVKLPYIYEFSTNSESGDAATGTYKLLVKCSGDVTYRSVTIKKNNRGLWKALEWGKLLGGIKKPPFDDKL